MNVGEASASRLLLLNFQLLFPAILAVMQRVSFLFNAHTPCYHRKGQLRRKKRCEVVWPVSIHARATGCGQIGEIVNKWPKRTCSVIPSQLQSTYKSRCGDGKASISSLMQSILISTFILQSMRALSALSAKWLAEDIERIELTFDDSSNG